MFRLLLAALFAVPCVLLLLPVLAIAGLLFLFVSGVRAIGRLFEPGFVPWADLMMFDRQLGWKPRADLDAYYLADRDDVFRVVTDGEGWPGTHSLDDSKVVVIGDSFAFGYGVDAGSSFADLKPGLAVKAVGAPGYSMVQSVLLMEQFAQRLCGKLVVWFVCLENDLEDNLSPAMRGYRAPFIRPSRQNGAWEIVDRHVGPTPWSSSNPGARRILPNLCVPGPLADRTYAGADYLIERAALFCAQVGANLVMVSIPDPSQLTPSGRLKLAALSGMPAECNENLPDVRLAESCARHGVTLVVGKDHLTGADYKRIEGLHWNEQGHRRVSEVLDRLYESFKSGAFGSVASKPKAVSERAPAVHEYAGSR